MSAQISPIFTPMHDEEVRNLTSSQEESLRKTIRNLNFLGNARPLGSILFIDVNQPGVPPVSTTMLQFCDGSEITTPSSPLRTIGLNARFTPNLISKFPRGAPLDSGNAFGGSAAWNLSHSHGGNTGGMTNSGSINGEEGDERKATTPHAHPISSDLTDADFDFPAYIGMAPYMKIK